MVQMGDSPQGPTPAHDAPAAVRRNDRTPAMTDVLALVWGFAEATFFFIVPDVLLTLTGAFSWRRAARQVVFTLMGAVLGGVLMFAWAARDQKAALIAVDRVPFVTAPMLDSVQGDVERHGVWALFRGPARGVPYKAYAVCMPGHTGMMQFAAVSVPGRAARFVVVVIVAALVGWAARRWFGERARRVIIGIHITGWAAFYAFYWTKLSIG
jgi:hypothetical protein